MGLTSCFAQNNIYDLDKINTYMKDYNSNFEKLDTSVLTQLSSLSKQKEGALPKQLTFPFKKNNFIIHRMGKDSYYFRQYDKNDNTMEVDFQVNLNGDIYYKEKIDELFYYNEVYYLNGNIKFKGISSWLGFSIDESYKYNREGNLVEVVNNDQDYLFNYEEVLKFCNANNIELQFNKMNKLKKITLKDGRKVWNIDYFNPETSKIDFYQLDGNTGKIIQKELNKEKYGIKHFDTN